jgi:hypothetical protein
MSDSSATRGLRERLADSTEDRLGRALSDLFENPLLGGALGRAADAREKAVQAQELAMGALNLPSAADIERLTRRLRSVSQRLEGIEDGVHRLGRTLAGQSIDARLAAIEQQLQALASKLGAQPSSAQPSSAQPVGESARASAERPLATKPKRASAAARTAAKSKRAAGTAAPAKRSATKRPAAKSPAPQRAKPPAR